MSRKETHSSESSLSSFFLKEFGSDCLGLVLDLKRGSLAISVGPALPTNGNKVEEKHYSEKTCAFSHSIYHDVSLGILNAGTLPPYGSSPGLGLEGEREGEHCGLRPRPRTLSLRKHPAGSTQSHPALRAERSIGELCFFISSIIAI